MILRKTYVLLLSLTLALMFLSLAGCSSVGKKATVSREDAAAMVNGVGISKAEWQMSFDALMNRYKSMGMPLDSVQTDSLKNQVLSRMITTELMYQKSTEAGYTFSEADVDSEFAKIKVNYPTDELFRTAMENQGLTEEMMRTQIERNLTIKNFIDAEIRPKQVVSDEEKRAYYEENKSIWDHDDEVAARHILIKTAKDDPPDTLASKKARIDALLARIRNGEELSDLAIQFSDCPSASKGGDLGYFSRGRMVKPFEDVAFSLNVGEISDVVKTDFGYHIIQVYDKRDAGTQPYEEVEAYIDEDLTSRKINEALRTLIDELKAKGQIERLL
jgi:peptidyl-prolyl cis-trans isomerase C